VLCFTEPEIDVESLSDTVVLAATESERLAFVDSEVLALSVVDATALFRADCDAEIAEVEANIDSLFAIE
jgi:hypothetical protein